MVYGHAPVRARDLEESGPILVPDLIAIGLIVVWGLAWLAPGLGHPSIHNWDEAFHQAVARGTAEAFPTPTMYTEPLFPTVLRYWWYTGVWMHKAAGVFWWAAAMIKLFGPSTLALRSASLLSQLAIAVLTYLMAREFAGRAIALLGSLAFLLLPWGWFMTQGHFVADVTDISVTAFVTLGMAWLWWAVEKDSWRWAALAGAAIGVGYLCKTFLALAPLGVAGAWWLLGVLRFCKGPSLKQVLLMLGGFLLIAAPWNLYAYLKWPDIYMRAFDHTVGFISATSGEDVGSGPRPPDAVFQEINFIILKPFPYPFTLLCGLWLAIKAVRDRDGRLVAVALWLWSTWLVHSVTHVKGHAHLWNAVPAVFLAYAVALRDAWRHRGLAVAIVASLLVWELKPTFAPLLALRQALPQLLVQVRTWEFSNLVEQFAFVPAAVLLAWLLGRALRSKQRLLARVTLATGALASLGTAAYAFPYSAKLNRAQAVAMDHDAQWSASIDLGRALDPVLEKKAVLFMDTNFDYGTTFEYLSLMLWSGRMVYRQTPEPAVAIAKGYHPYLVSPGSEPFAPLEQVPPYAGLRAYDLLKPGPPAPLPPGLTPLEQPMANLRGLGWAATRVNERWSRYAFFVEPRGYPTDFHAVFVLDDGSRIDQVLSLQSTLRPAQRLAAMPWFVVGAIGPPHDHVAGIELRQ